MKNEIHYTPLLMKAAHILVAVLAFAFSMPAHGQKKEKLRTLIVIFDGLRPDYVTEKDMPNLYRLAKSGTWATDNHSVFPTVTRVNASSYATGSYPSTHGLMGNSVFFPRVNASRVWNTGEAEEMMAVSEATLGNLLTSVTFGELLQKNGERFMVFSSGSTGQAYLQNHKIAGGAIINPMLILPNAMMPEVVKVLGSPPPYAKPNAQRHQWITNGYLHYGLADDGPAVSAIWYSDPDGTAHAEGIGSPLTMASIRIVDAELGRILSAIREKGLEKKVNIVVSTDHGFVTNVGRDNLTEFLIAEKFKRDKSSEDVVVAGGAIYVKDHDPVLITRIVESLQRQEWVGAVFTAGAKKGDTNGIVKGTLSFETIRWDHERAGDILVDLNWNDDKNAYGYAGASFYKGIAGHGGSSPWEIHIPLIAAGPSFKTKTRSSVPTSNIDIVPTLLKIHGIQIPETMEGRVLNELLAGNMEDRSKNVKKEVIETSTEFDWGTYVLQLERSNYGKHSYVNHTRVLRTQKGM